MAWLQTCSLQSLGIHAGSVCARLTIVCQHCMTSPSTAAAPPPPTAGSSADIAYSDDDQAKLEGILWWPKKIVDGLQRLNRKEECKALLERLVLTTSYSGMGAPEVALHMLYSYLGIGELEARIRKKGVKSPTPNPLRAPTKPPGLPPPPTSSQQAGLA